MSDEYQNEAFDTIEWRRPDFFTATALADAMLRNGWYGPELDGAIRTAQEAFRELEQAYYADINRMRAIITEIERREERAAYDRKKDTQA